MSVAVVRLYLKLRYIENRLLCASLSLIQILLLSLTVLLLIVFIIVIGVQTMTKQAGESAQRKYILIKAVLGKMPQLDIDKARYKALEAARDVLSNALAIEEKYEIVIANYLDFEKELLDKAVGNMARGAGDYGDFFQLRLDLNKRLVNLLTSGRLYIDQLSQHVCQCAYDKVSTKEIVKKLFAAQHDAHMEYRFMDALRNYVQHRGIAVHTTRLGANKTEEDELAIEYSVDAASLRDVLAEDSKFKKKVLAELPERVDLKTTVRQYVESLNVVHLAARKLIEDEVEKARTLIEKAQSDYAVVYSGSLTGLCAWIMNDAGLKDDGFPLLLDWDDVRLKLVKKNGQLNNLPKRYVSSRIAKQKAKKK